MATGFQSHDLLGRCQILRSAEIGFDRRDDIALSHEGGSQFRIFPKAGIQSRHLLFGGFPAQVAADEFFFLPFHLNYPSWLAYSCAHTVNDWRMR